MSAYDGDAVKALCGQWMPRKTLIGDSVTTAGNHWCMLPGGGSVRSGHGSIPFDHQGAPRRRPPAAWF